jgi:oxygen-dependent protoporphyrinogen oxidase
MGELVEALVSKLNRIQLLSGKKAKTVRATKQNSGPYQVDFEDGVSMTADALVLATPSFVTESLVGDINPLMARILQQIPYVSTATVSLAYKRSQCPQPLDGYGFVVSRAEKRKIMACTWTSTKFPHRAPQDQVLIRSFLGGPNQEHLVELDDAAMVETVRQELSEIMRLDATPVLSRVYRWRQANPQYTVGHLDRLATLQELLKRQPGLFLTGSAYYGVGIPDCIHQGTQTAQAVLEYLTPSSKHSS